MIILWHNFQDLVLVETMVHTDNQKEICCTSNMPRNFWNLVMSIAAFAPTR